MKTIFLLFFALAPLKQDINIVFDEWNHPYEVRFIFEDDRHAVYTVNIPTDTVGHFILEKKQFQKFSIKYIGFKEGYENLGIEYGIVKWVTERFPIITVPNTILFGRTKESA